MPAAGTLNCCCLPVEPPCPSSCRVRYEHARHHAAYRTTLTPAVPAFAAPACLPRFCIPAVLLPRAVIRVPLDTGAEPRNADYPCTFLPWFLWHGSLGFARFTACRCPFSTRVNCCAYHGWFCPTPFARSTPCLRNSLVSTHCRLFVI